MDIIKEIEEFEYEFHADSSGRNVIDVVVEMLYEDDDNYYTNTTITYIEGDSEIFEEVKYPKKIFLY